MLGIVVIQYMRMVKNNDKNLKEGRLNLLVEETQCLGAYDCMVMSGNG
jgi:hypothetical protein